MDVLRAALGESTADLLRGVVRHQARRDLRRAVPRPGRPDGARRGGGPVGRARASSASSRPPASRPRCAPTSQNCVDETDSCFLGDSRRRGAGDGSASSSDRSTQRRCRPATDRGLPVGNAFYGIVAAALQPRLLADAEPGAAAGVRRRRLGAAPALRPLLLARDRRRLRRQQRRGDLRDQLPRRPVRDPRRRRCRPSCPRSSRRRRPSGGLRLGADALPRRRGRRPTEPLAHDARAGAPPIVVVGTTRDPATPYSGPRRWPPSSTPGCWSPATATATPATTPATTCVDERRRVLPDRRQGPARRAAPAETARGDLAQRGRTGFATARIRATASSIISWAAGESVAFTRCTIANVSYWRGRSSIQPSRGASRGTSWWPRRGARRCRPAHADQLDRGLDVLDLDPGLRVVAGLVQHPAQRQPHRVRRPVAGVGHHQRGLGEPAGR